MLVPTAPVPHAAAFVAEALNVIGEAPAVPPVPVEPDPDGVPVVSQVDGLFELVKSKVNGVPLLAADVTETVGPVCTAIELPFRGGQVSEMAAGDTKREDGGGAMTFNVTRTV